METPLPPQPSETLDALLSIAPAEIQELLRDLVASLAPRFQGIRPLGQGGMGLVFRARDPLLKRDVAIKVLATRYLDDATARERFIREAQAAAMVAHPYVVSIFQVGELRETRLPYFVMQYIEGRTIGDAFPSGSRPPVDRVRRLTAQPPREVLPTAKRTHCARCSRGDAALHESGAGARTGSGSGD